MDQVALGRGIGPDQSTFVTAAKDLGEGRNGVEELLSGMTRAGLE